MNIFFASFSRKTEQKMQATIRGIRCVIATQSHRIGDVIMRRNSPVTDAIHHSCNSNAVIMNGKVVATQPIMKGTEIMLDFTSPAIQEENLAIQRERTVLCMDCGSVLTGTTTECEKIFL